MLYALTRENGTISVTTIMPKEVIIDGKTLPVSFVCGSEKYLTAFDGDEELRFPLPAEDMRTYEADSVPGATLTFFDIQYVIDNNPDKIVSYEKITLADLPPSRTYRDACVVSGSTIVHDMPMARNIHRTHLRQERQPRLADLDVLYQRADEDGDGLKKRAIAEEKKKLRDVTANPLIELATDVETLGRLTLEYLLTH